MPESGFGWYYPPGVTSLPGEEDACEQCEEAGEAGRCPHGYEEDPDRKRDEMRDASWEDVAYD